MKTIITILLTLLLTSSYSQNSTTKKTTSASSEDAITKEDLENLKKDAQNRRKHWPYIAKFIKKEYSDKATKEIPAIQKKIDFYKSKLATATTPGGKKNYEKKLKEQQVLLEVAKMWPIYEKAYIIYNKAYEDKDDQKYDNGLNVTFKIAERYTKLTASIFPDPTIAFYRKYGDRIKKSASAEKLRK